MKKRFWQKHEKMKKGIIAAAMAVTIAIATFPVFENPDFGPEFVYATSDTKEQMEEAERERDQKEQELEAAQQQLASTQSTISSLQGVRNTYQGQMNLLNSELQLVSDNLAVLEAQIDLKQLEIDDTLTALELAKETRENQYESMKERIQFMYERGSQAYLEILFSAESFGEFLNYAVYVEQLTAYDRRMLNEYIQTEEDITLKEAELEAEMDELEQMRADVVTEQNRVNGLISDTASSIAATLDSIEDAQAQADAYEQECDQKAAEAAAAAAEYERIKAQYEEELRLSQLAAQSTWRDISQVTFEEGDRYLLANLIYCEAGAEPYAGKVAVGSVVINRVLSSVYPDTVTGVIYQRKQFSPTLDGHLALALAENRATESCYQAADEAMSGVTNVGNCVYFRTPIEGLTGISIGGHIFY